MGRLLLLLVVGAATALGAWIAVARAAPSGADRLLNVGLGLTLVGVVWTAIAWWMVIPEVILAAGLVAIVAGLLRRRVTT